VDKQPDGFIVQEGRLALSGDGSTIAVTTLNHLVVWHFDGVHWLVQGDQPLDPRTYYRISRSISLSADGSVAVVGEQRLDGGPDEGVVVVRHLGSWAKAGGAVVPPGDLSGNAATFTVSGDGTEVAAADNANPGFSLSTGGHVYVYRISGPSAPVQQLPIETYNATELALSRDGSTIAVSASLSPPSVAVFHRGSTGTWSRTATFAPAPNRRGGASAYGWGGAFALSANGSTLVVGDLFFGDGYKFGAGYRYVLSGGQWHWGGLLVAAHAAYLGQWVHLSSDGHRVVLDGQLANTANAAGFVFDSP
jgi:hypothetical protein